MRALISSILAFFITCSGCRGNHDTVVVHVLRDRNGIIGKNIDAAISATSRNLLTPDGRPILIATYEINNYGDALARLIATRRPEIIIFNSRADWKASNLGVAATQLKCAPDATCVASIAPWSTAANRDASEQVLKMIASKL